MLTTKTLARSLYKALHQIPAGSKRLSFKDKMRMALEVARGMGYYPFFFLITLEPRIECYKSPTPSPSL